MLILGIESSCDETAASVAEDYTKIRSNVVASQVKEHQLYGGVVPEIASRRHCENVLPAVQKALDDAQVTLADLDGIAVTYAPGLIGALLVGVNFAKGLALATGKPLVPVHHLAGHIAANYIAHPELKPPYLCLVASGGHSHIVEVLSYTEFRIVGRTRDDAAGECFDKTARAMGFPYPGGIHIDHAAQEGNPEAFHLPRPKVEGNPYDFSFSGLKTAVVQCLPKGADRFDCRLGSIGTENHFRTADHAHHAGGKRFGLSDHCRCWRGFCKQWRSLCHGSCLRKAGLQAVCTAAFAVRR